MSSTSRATLQPLIRNALSSCQMLTVERERELLVRYHASEDKAAMDELVRSHLPIIFRVASRGKHNPGVDINDLVQTATEGLLMAINRWSFEKSDTSSPPEALALIPPFAPDASHDEEAIQHSPQPFPHSSRLATYAMWWMRILVNNSVVHNRGMIVRAKNPKVRRALYNIPTAIRKLEISLPLTGYDVTRIAAYLGICEHEIQEALVHAAGDVMLDQPLGDGAVPRGEAFADDRSEDEDAVLARLASTDRWDAVCAALMGLPPRERFILVTRYLLGTKWKLDRLSDTLKMSRERIRQIASDALARIHLRVGPVDVKHDATHQNAAAEAHALISIIERASASSDPTALAALLVEQHITTGPMRASRQSHAGAVKPIGRVSALPCLAPTPRLAAA